MANKNWKDKRNKDKESKGSSNTQYSKPSESKGTQSSGDDTWNKHPELTAAAGTLAFAQALGQPLDIDAVGSVFHNPAGVGYRTMSTPGLWGLGLGLTYGTAVDEGSALNVAARNLYTYIRHWNSGHTNYDNTTLMQYLITVDQIYAAFSWCCRIYGTLLNYKVLNRYTPDDVLKIQHVDAASFRGNMAQFKFDIDQWAVRLQSFLVPDTIPLFRRHFKMFANYYLDAEDSQVAQMYVFFPSKLFAWDDAAASVEDHFVTVLDTRRQIEIASYSGGLMKTGATLPYGSDLTFSDIETMMETMLSAVATTEDFNIISGDILKAYGAERTWTVPMISSDYIAEPIFDFKALIQIHNLTHVKTYKVNVNASVTDADVIAWAKAMNDTCFRPTEILDPVTLTSYLKMDIHGMGSVNTPPVSAMPKILDLPVRMPTPEDNMGATRLTVVSGPVYRLATLRDANNAKTYLYSKPTQYGTEIVTDMILGQRLFLHEQVNGDYRYDILSEWVPSQSYIYGAADAAIMGRMAKFTLAPLCYIVWDMTNASYTTWKTDATMPDLQFVAGITFQGGELTSASFCEIAGEVDHHTVVSADVIGKLHTAAILSAFNIPEGALKG